MSDERTVRIRTARCVTARFAPIVGAGLCAEWDGVLSGYPGADGLVALLSTLADPGAVVGLDEIEALLESLEELLDLFGEEPTGSAYYPFKAAELIELYGRSATGDLPDDAPVPLAEWVDRFAGHVDRRLAVGGVDLGRPRYFGELERSLRGREPGLTGRDDAGFRAFVVECRSYGAEYVSALTRCDVSRDGS
ncbi:hypothetical protein ACGFYE_25640 [Streptomyces zaomyceticus]|uniref:hypothetical protein n=1 Tax=Streptomyces zaomyceticus TaxID=68286 RepID=UPI00371BBD6F